MEQRRWGKDIAVAVAASLITALVLHLAGAFRAELEDRDRLRITEKLAINKVFRGLVAEAVIEDDEFLAKLEISSKIAETLANSDTVKSLMSGAAGYVKTEGFTDAVANGSGRDLSPRHLLATGGNETVTLAVSEIPAHMHRLPTRGGGRTPSPEEIWALLDGGMGSLGPLHERHSETVGNWQPHENMPPFVVLLLCERI